VQAAATYRGRFAPSPTGALHFGSVVAAVASYLDARAHGGEWLVRMEDVDKTRERPGAADAILRTLERFGFEWDGPVWVQSARTAAYEAAMRRLDVYGCACSRRESPRCGCRNGLGERTPRAWRVCAPGVPVCFDDGVQGRHCDTPGDFIVRRADGFFAYQLAVVVDDAEQGSTHVVRGADLLDSTPRQIVLQRMLGCPQPGYMHIPVAVDERGGKLSKQNLAPGVDGAANVIRAALAFLGQPPCDTLRDAIPEWRADRIPRVLSLPAPDL
jgi:glutamyl-Q tRNA(Asp) synthetase